MFALFCTVLKLTGKCFPLLLLYKISENVNGRSSVPFSFKSFEIDGNSFDAVAIVAVSVALDEDIIVAGNGLNTKFAKFTDLNSELVSLFADPFC